MATAERRSVSGENIKPFTIEQARRLFEKCNWKVPLVKKELNAMDFYTKSLSTLDIFERAGLIEAFREQFIKQINEYGRTRSETGRFFNVHERTIGAWLDDPRLIPEPKKLAKTQAAQLFKEHGWNVPAVILELQKKGFRQSHVKGDGFLEVFERAGVMEAFKNKFIAEAKKCARSPLSIAQFFGVIPGTARQWLEDPRLLPRPVKVSAKAAADIFKEKKWHLNDAANELIHMGVPQTRRGDFMGVFAEVNAVGALREKFIEAGERYL
ncbi:MAG: hypothetical protein NTV07_00810 [Candidatus Omnitrophica bacterium]|nr:hypothetical protein [Candidatus Omnitrophota bacterium]